MTSNWWHPNVIDNGLTPEERLAFKLMEASPIQHYNGSNNAICPYCEERMIVQYTEIANKSCQCMECGKTFRLFFRVHVSSSPVRAIIR